LPKPCNIDFMNNKTLGDIGEQIAKKYLEDKGYVILERNYKNKWAEIDLVCQDSKKIIFVEVKTRIGEQFGLPEDAINKNKMQRLVRSATAYMVFKHLGDNYRIDVICIVLSEGSAVERIDHYENITL
jgi:putative endonuclease